VFLQGITGADHEAIFFCAERDSKIRGCEKSIFCRFYRYFKSMQFQQPLQGCKFIVE
jgi:hypothetical protein